MVAGSIAAVRSSYRSEQSFACRSECAATKVPRHDAGLPDLPIRVPAAGFHRSRTTPDSTSRPPSLPSPRPGLSGGPIQQREKTIVTTNAEVAASPSVAVSGTSLSFPSWTFQIPVDIAKLGFQIAIYGQDPRSLAWMYWNPSASGYTGFASGVNGQDTAPLINATPNAGGYTSPVSLTVNLPATQLLQSGVVAMFIGGSSGIPVASGVPASPTTATNPNDLYSLFEFTYSIPKNGTTPSLDIDISNVDQVGFTYTVQSSSAPFPLSLVGSSVPKNTVFTQFATAFPAGTPFNECLVYGQAATGVTVRQLRLLAPQDVLQAIAPPNAPSYLAPAGAPSDPEPFAHNTYFYRVSETSATGETAANSVGVFGGFLLNPSGQPQAKQINIGWLSGTNPGAYTPTNPTATAINLYRASGPAANAGSTPPAAPAAGYGLLKGMTITEWNAQQPPLFGDDSTSIGSQAPKASSYGFSALSTWFDAPLRQFFEHFAANKFALYQFNQGGGSGGTLWTGKVIDVTPQTGDSITTLTYVDQNGNAQSIGAGWTWGNGTQSYKVLQLVGNAYDANDFSNTNLAGASGLTQGEYQGAVVNLYFPYFTGNTGLTSIAFGGGSYTLPPAPSWLNNASNGPSQMVFGCAGTFATSNDPDAVAQESSFPVLAANSLTNLQNVVVSALNRGIATGYNFALEPLGYTCQYGFLQAPQATAGGTLPAGTYTYYLSGTLNDGNESVLSWPQTIMLTEASAVELKWLPQPLALYKQANVYRQAGTGAIQLIGTVANTASSQATSFTDTGGSLPSQPANGAPFVFYPSWNDSSGTGFVNSNLFSAFLHQNLSADTTNGISINGLVYGYPFDDQGNFSTNINYGTAIPQSITFAITELG
ncbi:MAG TPA: hypothetical protein VFS20_28120 [Longimicrobium sp.]|nr:hypothetical protein [Longimicrobium sp.]